MRMPALKMHILGAELTFVAANLSANLAANISLMLGKSVLDVSLQIEPYQRLFHPD